jgi:High potential iron-sulfur protein
MTSSRRTFFIQAVTGAGALSALSLAQYARAQAMVAETDPQASALGYKADAATVDKVKYPKYAAGQMCGNCALFQGKPADAAGGCPLFAGKQVATKGWCSAWAKKA